MAYALALALYRLLWLLALPLVLGYFWLRGRRAPAYRKHLAERFGFGPSLAGAVWVHAVSLGEMRSAAPLVRALLDRGERVVTTHLTPTGRRAAETAFAAEIAAGRMVVRYLPLELGWAYRRFLRQRPKLALVMEIEVWPVMIAAAARAGVPLVLTNSQYPARSFARDRWLAWWIGHPVARVAAVLAKSETHAVRFRDLGARAVLVCGELRFDQPVAPHLLAAAAALRPAIASRKVVVLASVVEGEDSLYLGAIRALQDTSQGPPPLVVYVPRAPERFDEVAKILTRDGQRLQRRSRVLDAGLTADPVPDLSQTDILLGDSLGEMYFYLALADLVVVGGGFLPSGAHNVIEPLALAKPVLTGPQVWSIEYPGVEAVAAGALEVCATPEALGHRMAVLLGDGAALAEKAARGQAFFVGCSGATGRTLAALAQLGLI